MSKKRGNQPVNKGHQLKSGHLIPGRPGQLHQNQHKMLLMTARCICSSLTLSIKSSKTMTLRASLFRDLRHPRKSSSSKSTWTRRHSTITSTTATSLVSLTSCTIALAVTSHTPLTKYHASMKISATPMAPPPII